MKITKLIIASHNEGKIAEIKTLLSPLNIEVQSANELHLPDVEETGKTFEENAVLKAKTLSKMCGIPCLADDSGLCVEALDGRPGVYSARYAPNRDFGEGMKLLLNEMSQAKSKERDAHFVCVMALSCPDKKVKVFEGRIDGRITEEPMGDKGFGYDPIFVPNGYDKSFAQLDAEIKNSMSHRKKALEKVVNFIKESR